VRWRKLLEWAIADSYEETLWQPLAVFVAARRLRPASAPSR
jgi:hypothetical protein